VNLAFGEKAPRAKQEEDPDQQSRGDGRAAVLIERWQKQPHDRCHAHQSDRRAPEERTQPSCTIAEEEDQHRAEARRERRRGAGQPEHRDLQGG
jgi:hypothetical protein